MVVESFIRIMRTLISVCLLLALTGPLTAATADIQIEDPAGNLTGDSKRGYVDITEVHILQETASLTVEIKVRDSFPEPSILLGTGMQFVFRFLGADEEAPEFMECQMELNDRGWSIQRSGDNTESLPVDFRVSSDEVAVIFPYAILREASRLEIVADTANRPKWRPLTANPAIMVELPPPPQRPETAIQ